MRAPRRRHGDWRSAPPETAAPRAGDRLVEPLAADPWLVLNREIDRCRRYRHPLALVRVAATAGPSDATSLAARARREGQPSRRRAVPPAEVVATLLGSLRSGDAAWHHHRDVFVLAPETDAAGAEAMGTRVREIAEALLGGPVDLRIASFPEHGLTGHALRARLAAREPRLRKAGDGRGASNGARTQHRAGIHWLGDGAAPEMPDRAD
jgi:hypothetical protein